jgi:DNA adenine methylase
MIKPLYIWAGGKRKMIPHYTKSPTIPLDGYDTYVEPFFGGGAMMLHIYNNNPTVKNFIMNDINPEIVGIYTAIKTDVTNFLQRMDQLQAHYMPLNKEDRKKYFYEMREQYTTNWHVWSPTEESATLYFLMKTAFNGIWQVNQKSNGRFATPSGLLNQKTTVYDNENVMAWHDFLQRVDIRCGDWSSAVQDVSGRAFYFLDPPYRDSFTTYGQSNADQMQDDIIAFCRDRDAVGDIAWFCGRDSGDDFYTSRQGNLRLETYDIKYTAGRRKREDDGGHSAKKATEILLHNTIPLIDFG